ncbi:MAG: DegT/DnrJ/EryC1/StrS family aminotransferase [Sphingobacteriaceae bacterium]
MDIQMVDLQRQYLNIQSEIDHAVLNAIREAAYINGPEVKLLEEKLQLYSGSKHVIPCANGTDALQIALMALNLAQGDEIIIPAFTYVATAEVIALLGLVPVMVEVDPYTFNINPAQIEAAITPRSKAIVPVHLYGQSADMEPILQAAEKYHLWVIEDNAQSFGAEYTFSDGTTKKTGTMGHIGCNSFFPTKNLGCYGDGGAIATDEDELAMKIRMIANHGQKIKYHHAIIGCNSRLDTIQAAILNVKMTYFDHFLAARKAAADYYDHHLKDCAWIKLPRSLPNAGHTYNQYTLRIEGSQRDLLQSYLKQKGIPTMIYYPLPLYRQEAYSKFVAEDFALPITEQLCQSVLSIPMHTELTPSIQEYISEAILNFK